MLLPKLFQASDCLVDSNPFKFAQDQKEQKVNILPTEKFPTDTEGIGNNWDYYLPDFQCSRYWFKFGGSEERCLREWLLAKWEKDIASIW